MRRMAVIAVTLALAGCVDYSRSVLDPWVGAPESDLVSKWGYPQSANDIVNIDASTKVYTYRTYPYSIKGFPCTVSFTLESGYVKRANYFGDGCPEIRR